MKKAFIVTDPETTRVVFSYRKYEPSGGISCRDEPALLEAGHASIRRSPNLPSTVFKQGLNTIVRQSMAFPENSHPAAMVRPYRIPVHERRLTGRAMLRDRDGGLWVATHAPARPSIGIIISQQKVRKSETVLGR